MPKVKTLHTRTGKSIFGKVFSQKIQRTLNHQTSLLEKGFDELLRPTHEDEYHLPQLYKLSNVTDRGMLSGVLQKYPHTRIIDTYDGQLEELLEIENPNLRFNHLEKKKESIAFKKKHYGKKKKWQVGTWVYLPWRHVLIHILEDKEYQRVRTARNCNLITVKEQKKYHNSVIGVTGQSVGNSCTLAIVQTGGGGYMRIADPDILEVTNLNRIRSSIAEVSNLKIHMTARQIYELNPYAQVDLFSDGITEENIEKFFDGPPKLDIIIDEIDNLGLKIRLRQEAKKRGIPVVMATDNGDSGVLDIERHDLDKDIPLFHGRAGDDLAGRVIGKDVPLPVIGKIIGEELIGYDITESRMQDSLLEIGKSIPTWPQLGTAATLNGAIVAVAVRKILTGQPIIDNRANVSVQEWLVPGYMNVKEVKKRTQKTKKFSKTYNQVIDEFLQQKQS